MSGKAELSGIPLSGLGFVCSGCLLLDAQAVGLQGWLGATRTNVCGIRCVSVRLRITVIARFFK